MQDKEVQSEHSSARNRAENPSGQQLTALRTTRIGGEKKENKATKKGGLL